MERIIQTCFLVTAFAGILLSCAQETSVSGVSDPTPVEQTSPSAPEISFTSVATTSHESSSPAEAEAGTSDSKANDASNQKADEPSTSKEELRHDTTPSIESENSETTQNVSPDSREKSDSTLESTTGSSLSHSQGLFRAGLQDGKPTAGEVSTEKLFSSTAGDVTTDQITSDLSSHSTLGSNLEITRETGDETDAPTRTSVATKTSEVDNREDTTRGTTLQSTEMHSLNNSSKDSGQSSVPSKEDAISNSSDVGKILIPEEMSSATPSKVQTDDSDPEDNAKSATRKRSLNATNTLAGGTTVTISGPPSSPVLDTSNRTVLLSETTDVKTDESVTENGKVTLEKQTEVPLPDNLNGQPTNEAETIVSSTGTEGSDSPYTINSASGNFDASAVNSTQDELMTSEITSISSLPETHTLSISSAALSSFSEESIHPSENIDTTAQVSNVGHHTTTVATPRGRSPELEDSTSFQESDSSVSTLPVTFDPNGMTHNFSQDPDSVIFPSQIFHVDGMPTDAYLSQVDGRDSADQNPPLLTDQAKNPTEGTTGSAEAAKDNSGSMEGEHSSQREREGVVDAKPDTIPRDEPDAEEMSNRNTVQTTDQSTVHPLLFKIHSSPGETKDVYPLTDESEEMLNDSPDFEPIQSKSTVASITDAKNNFKNKDLEINVSNDISQTTGASSQMTSKSGHELDFSIDYQPEQSEIRPVTATSPLNTSESITVLPGSFNVGSQAPPEVTMSVQPDTVLPDAESPIVLPNPAPSVVNQSTEAVAVVIQPDVASGGNVSGVKSEEESTSNSTIAGVAVKTSVSVSLPLSNSPNSTANSTSGEVMGDADISPNITGIILPVPILVNKDADGHPPPPVVSTEASTEATTVPTGLRIRKPKLKIGGTDAPETPRTRKPFLSPPQKQSTTAGPPVSIFKNARTRIASITSSTTARPFPQFSTIRIHYASRLPGIVPNGEQVFTLEPTTTTEPTTTETEEPFTDDPFTEPTQGFSMPSEDVVTIVKIAGYIVVDKGLRWNDQLINRHSPQYKEKSKYVQSQLDRLFRTSGIGNRLWKTEIDGFSGKRKTRSVAIDFFLYIAKSPIEITPDQLKSIFHDKLINNTFSRFTVDTSKTTFEILNEEPLLSTTEAPEAEPEPVIPQWAIAVIVVGAASLIFIVLFAVVAILGRHHMRRRYSNKLNDEDSDRPSDWESKMAAAYENLAADTIYDAEDLHSDTYKKRILTKSVKRRK